MCNFYLSVSSGLCWIRTLEYILLCILFKRHTIICSSYIYKLKAGAKPLLKYNSGIIWLQTTPEPEVSPLSMNTAQMRLKSQDWCVSSSKTIFTGSQWTVQDMTTLLLMGGGLYFHPTGLPEAKIDVCPGMWHRSSFRPDESVKGENETDLKVQDSNSSTKQNLTLFNSS